MEFPPPPTEENTNDPTPLTAASFQIYDHSLGHGTTFFPDRRNMIPFLSSPVPCSQKIQCIITRYRTGIHKWAPGYELFLQFGQQRFFLLSARKKKMQHATTYYMYSQPLPYISKYSLIAKLKSNWMGTVFTLTGPSYMGSDHVKRKDELAAILYDTNVLGFKGPRKMKLVLPRVNKEGIPFRITPNDKNDTLIARMESGNDQEILILKNKSPKWNEETHSYVLNFNGRVTVASVKNFQIIPEQDVDYIVMQFGRTDDGEFCMDCQYPISPIQCFGVCLSSFDPKLACE